MEGVFLGFLSAYTTDTYYNFNTFANEKLDSISEDSLISDNKNTTPVAGDIGNIKDFWFPRLEIYAKERLVLQRLNHITLKDKIPKRRPQTNSVFYMPIIDFAFILVMNSNHKTDGFDHHLREQNVYLGMMSFDIYHAMLNAIINTIITSWKSKIISSYGTKDKPTLHKSGYLQANVQENILEDSKVERTVVPLIYADSAPENGKTLDFEKAATDVKSLLDIFIQTRYK